MDRIAGLMEKYQMPDDMPIKAKLVTKAVEGAQRKVEEINFAMRKNVLDYDDVMNTQRQVIYEERNKILDGKDLVAHIHEVTQDTVERFTTHFCSQDLDPDDWDLEGLKKWMIDLTGNEEVPNLPDSGSYDELVDFVYDFVEDCYREKSERLSDDIMKELSAQVMLRVIDTRWMAYLQEMDYLKTGIGLRGFGQRDPLVEYKTEAFAAFTELVNTMYEDFLRTILHIELMASPAPRENTNLEAARYSGPQDVDGDHGPKHFRDLENPHADGKPAPYRKSDQDPYAHVGRNEECPCGSGLKFKNCHGRNR